MLKQLVIASAALGLAVSSAAAEGCNYDKSSNVTAQSPVPAPTTVAAPTQSLIPADQKVAEAPAPAPVKTN